MKREDDGFLRHQYREVAVILEQLCSTIERIDTGKPGTPMFRITEADWLAIGLAVMTAQKRLNALDARFHHEPASRASSKQAEKSCSFCGRSGLEPKSLFVGDGAFICDQCIVLYQGIIAREDQTPSTGKQTLSKRFLASICNDIGDAMVPITTHQQLLADKWRDAEFRASLDVALANGVKRIAAVVNMLRHWDNYLGGMPAPPVAPEAVAPGVEPHLGVPAVSVPAANLQAGPRIAMPDRPVADLTLNDLFDEHARLCAERELGRPSPAALARLEEVLRRIEYLEWPYEI